MNRPARALDALNFTLADVRDGTGPYLAVYLLTVRHWDQTSIGLALSVGGIAGLLAQVPAGALVDALRAKRALVAVAAVVVTAVCLLVPVFPQFWPVLPGLALFRLAMPETGRGVAAAPRIATAAAG
jgi:predicted MFS family arabinose efflux permease